MRALALVLLLAVSAFAGGDPLAPRPNGPRDLDPDRQALVGATIHVRPGEVLEGATIHLAGGEIAAVSGEAPPPGARVFDLRGHHVYAGFFDPFVPVDAPRPPAGPATPYGSPLVFPGRSALDGAGLDAETARALRELGFAAALAVPRDGDFRGTAALVSAAEVRESERRRVYPARPLTCVSFDTAPEDSGYPDSLMGAIALLRQVLIDGLAPPGAALLFDVADELSVLRAGKVAAEAGRDAVVVGSGTEFRRIPAIAGMRGAGGGPVPLVVPLSFPEKPAVATVPDRAAAELRALFAWERGPENAALLDAAGIPVALTSSKIPDRAKFAERLGTAVRRGLDPERALAMLTTRPAALAGAADRLGAVAPGYRANLVVTDGPLFGEGSRIRYLFADGRPHEIRPPRLTGTWEVVEGPAVGLRLALAFDAEDGLRLRAGERSAGAKGLVTEGARVAFGADLAELGGEGALSVGTVRQGEELVGDGVGPGGIAFRFRARRVDAAAPAAEKKGRPAEGPAPPPPAPPAARAPARVAIRGGTLWTCGPAGVVPDGVLVAAGGRIVYAGPAGPAADAAAGSGALVIDAAGLHVTPGIVDCHSHTAIAGGVNESGRAVTAAARIEDVLDPDDPAIWRALAGGVTASNLLHGSANPIGGQNAVVKWRWGAERPEDLLLAGAPPGIKLALGENVKQSNWGEKFTTRYPQTRMGVEALVRDRFAAAREYDGSPRDLELEALAEVLAGKRLVHCHAYRQDEILMLCQVAGDFGFRIGTFQHALEAYKVAEEIREHSGGASVFSDWWAYKVEVQDAIPENGAILYEQGVLVSFNSDSGELARRLNVEAGKAVKYGGVPPAEALKFVTLNPANQLGVGDRIGSLEAGKEADFALWSGDPLSSRTRCVATWVDGVELFSLARDAAIRDQDARERERLIAKALAAPDDGEGDGKKGGGR